MLRQMSKARARRRTLSIRRCTPNDGGHLRGVGTATTVSSVRRASALERVDAALVSNFDGTGQRLDRPRAEDRGADADDGRTLGDSDLEIFGHPHRQLAQVDVRAGDGRLAI